MKKIVFTTLAAMGTMILPAAAHAQGATKPDITIGASVGLHDLDADVGDTDVEDFNIDESGEIYGAFAAVDFPIGETLFAGIEGNAHLGSGPIEAEYGASARFGLRTEGGAKIYARGGYQWVDLDVEDLTGVSEDFLDDNNINVDDVEGDYLLGLGVEFPVSSLVLRANVDTIAFDTLRGTVGIGLKF